MPIYQSLDNKVEVNGAEALSFINANEYGKDLRREMLEDNGIVNPSEDTWHPWQQILDFMKQLEEEIGEKSMYQLGITVIDNIDPPKPMDTIKDGVEVLDLIHQSLHRGGEFGSYTLESLNEEDQFALIKATAPYPTNGLRGFFTGVVRRAVPKKAIQCELFETDLYDPVIRWFKVSW